MSAADRMPLIVAYAAIACTLRQESSRCLPCVATRAFCISVRSCFCSSPARAASSPVPGPCSPIAPSPTGSRSACPGSIGICGSILCPAFSSCCSARWWSRFRSTAPATRASLRAAGGPAPASARRVHRALRPGMQMLVLADDALVFMIFWEMMSLSGYFLVVYQHQHAANRHAAFLYLLLAHVGALSYCFPSACSPPSAAVSPLTRCARPS